METVKALCDELVLEVDGALACAVADVETGEPVAAATSAGSVLDAAGIGLVCQAASNMLAGRLISRFRQAWSSRDASTGGFVREVQLTTANSYHFIGTVPGAWDRFMVLVTDRSVSIGLGWMSVHEGLERLDGIPWERTPKAQTAEPTPAPPVATVPTPEPEAKTPVRTVPRGASPGTRDDTLDVAAERPRRRPDVRVADVRADAGVDVRADLRADVRADKDADKDKDKEERTGQRGAGGKAASRPERRSADFGLPDGFRRARMAPPAELPGGQPSTPAANTQADAPAVPDPASSDPEGTQITLRTVTAKDKRDRPRGARGNMFNRG